MATTYCAGEMATSLNCLGGKHLLLVGTARDKKVQGFWYEAAREIGLKLSVADKPGQWTEEVVRSLMHGFFPIDLDMPTESLADELVKIVNSSEIKFSAITTLADTYLVAVAEAAEKLGMPTVGSEVYRNIRDKERTRILVDSPVLKYRIKGTQDLREAAKTVGFPAVLKPVHGRGSLAVHLVKSAHELQEVYSFLKSKLPAIKDILGGIPDFMLEQYIDGSEHNVDMIIQNGETLFAAVSDEKLCDEPWFKGESLSYPSKLSGRDQKALIDCAIKACSKIKMTDGVINIDLKLSKNGPRLLEINGRLGGGYIFHGVKAVWGVDLLQHAYEIAMGLPVSQLPNKGSLDISANPSTTFAVVKYVQAPYTGYIQEDNFLSPLQHNKNISLVFPLVKKGQKVKGPEDDVPDILAFFFVTGTKSLEATKEEAEEALNSLKLSEILIQQ